MEHLVRCGRNRRKDKSLGHLGYSDLNYHRIWVNFYLDRLDSLLKTDITMIKDTFNKLKLHDEDIGRDLFWRLGLRFQQCVINTSAAR
ncbi:hypothetical protein Pmar_PMAR006687, partial [Perkinsus marinus ATCC 50983]